MNLRDTGNFDTWPDEWRELVHETISGFHLDVNGIHGAPHWSRVLANGIRLSETTGANIKVITAFALLHDCQRENDGFDPEHGLRGAQHGRLVRELMPSISDIEFDLFYEAAEFHSEGLVDGDITIQTCWDADRLDLYRVGIYPDPQRLCTEVAKRAEVIEWAVSRSNG